MTYRAVGSHPIRVASGDFAPGDCGIVLTDAEAVHLQRAGAVEPDQDAGPAAPTDDNTASVGLSDDESQE